MHGYGNPLWNAVDIVLWHPIESDAMKTWAQKAVHELEARGWSLTAIAEETGLSLGSVSDLKQLRTKEPAGLVRAMKLRELHESQASPLNESREKAA